MQEKPKPGFGSDFNSLVEITFQTQKLSKLSTFCRGVDFLFLKSSSCQGLFSKSYF